MIESNHEMNKNKQTIYYKRIVTFNVVSTTYLVKAKFLQKPDKIDHLYRTWLSVFKFYDQQYNTTVLGLLSDR